MTFAGTTPLALSKVDVIMRELNIVTSNYRKDVKPPAKNGLQWQFCCYNTVVDAIAESEDHDWTVVADWTLDHSPTSVEIGMCFIGES